MTVGGNNAFRSEVMPSSRRSPLSAVDRDATLPMRHRTNRRSVPFASSHESSLRRLWVIARNPSARIGRVASRSTADRVRTSGCGMTVGGKNAFRSEVMPSSRRSPLSAVDRDATLPMRHRTNRRSVPFASSHESSLRRLRVIARNPSARIGRGASRSTADRGATFGCGMAVGGNNAFRSEVMPSSRRSPLSAVDRDATLPMSRRT